ncbi:hypothetical protein BH23ACT2_BH23ACT2_02700 [soil metagenome]
MVMQHVVVDGSNIATEGRTAPSLAQLDEAVRAFLSEFGDVKLTVVVDATFGHRIDDSENAEFDAGIVNGELVTPPAGAIGRGDAFVLQIADKAGASVFSNDSFQEFHGTYDWLFDEGRLVGGKPVPSVGWVFVLRTPVRGPTSRRSTRESKSAKGAGGSKRLGPPPIPTKPPPVPKAGKGSSDRSDAAQRTSSSSRRSSAKGAGKVSDARASKEPKAARDDVAPSASSSAGKGGRRRGSGSSTDPINEPMPFLQFVTDHPVGTEVEATVDRFSSHGAYAVTIGGAHCYIPLKAMADPAPTKAREILSVGEVRTFVVTAFDSSRRGIDVGLPGVVSPGPTESPAPDRHHDGLPDGEHQPAKEAPSMAVKKKAAAKKSVTKKSPVKKSPAKKSPAKKSPAKKSPAKKSPAKKSPAKKSPAKKSPAKKAASASKSVAKKARSATKSVVKKAPGTKTGARKAPAKKAR